MSPSRRSAQLSRTSATCVDVTRLDTADLEVLRDVIDLKSQANASQ